MTKSLFSNRTGDGNRGCRPNSGFPQIDQETQGPGANKTARAVMQAFSHCRRAARPAGGERQMEREARRRQRRPGPASSRDPSEGSFSSTPGLQRPLRAAVRQAAPSSHSGAPLHGARTQFPLRPRGSLCARVHCRVPLLSKSSDDTINSGSLLCLRPCRKINDR